MNLLRSIPVLSLLVAVSPAFADASAGIFAILDEVVLEPSDIEPDRIRLTGVFVLPQAVSSGLHRPPERGQLYFSLNRDFPAESRADWRALSGLAGNGQVVAFAEYWMPADREAWFARLPAEARQSLPDSRSSMNTSLVVRLHVDDYPVVPEVYPRPNVQGVITSFDAKHQLCPRFGKSASEIVSALWQAHDPDLARPPLPVCAERVGLFDGGALDSIFPTQVRDEAWARSAERLLGQRIADSGVELVSLSIECRYTICHVVFAYPSVAYQNETGNQLAAAALRDIPGFVNGGRVEPPLNGEATRGYWIQRRMPE